MPANIYEAIWIFLIYAFLGWCSEVAFAAVNQGKFINRGFLNGPVCPIYGAGMLIVLLALWPLRNNMILLFLGAAGLTTVLEYLTGFILESVFHEKWWDYSDMPFNIKGYVCLKFTILWGFAASFVVGAVHTFIYFVVTKTPFILGVVLLIVFCIAFVADFAVTLYQILKLPKRLNSMLELEKVLKTVSDSIGENISDTTIAAKEKGNDFIEAKKPQIDELKAEYEKRKEEFHRLAEGKNYVHNRILTAYPNLKNGKYKAVFDRLSNIRGRKTERVQNEKNEL